LVIETSLNCRSYLWTHTLPTSQRV